MRTLLLTLLILGLPTSAYATDVGMETGLPTPRFVSLKSDEINMRKGPGTRYPIEWVYRRKHLPVEVTEEFGQWRRIRDRDGTSGWLHKQMLIGARTILTKQHIILKDDPEKDATTVAKLEAGVIAKLKECEQEWCMIEVGDTEGWLKKTNILRRLRKRVV